ncbi:hypothetical protein CVN56_30715 [Rhodococcus sp. AQ5-07]|nr:hypothetical protein CVN56_30715 [Rhodococcus sp. AQ5-07]
MKMNEGFWHTMTLQARKHELVGLTICVHKLMKGQNTVSAAHAKSGCLSDITAGADQPPTILTQDG